MWCVSWRRIVYVDLKTIKKASYIKLRIEYFHKDSNVSFNLDVFMFSGSCCFNVGELQLAKWTKSSFFTIFLRKDKKYWERWRNNRHKSCLLRYERNHECWFRFAVNKIDKSHGRPKKYQKEIVEKVKRKVGNHALTFGTSSAIKKFSVKYPKFMFIRNFSE